MSRLKVNGFEINVISAEDLIISKLIWMKDSLSELHLNDIRNLMRNEINKDYLLNQISKLNLIDILNKIQNTDE